MCHSRLLSFVTSLLAGVSQAACGQASRLLAVGDVAPDFTLPAASAGGVAASPIRLTDLRDQTVVIAFFYRARTKG